MNRGRMKVVTIAQPAAGVEFTQTVPAGVRWRLFSARFQLDASAAAANRKVRVYIDDGASIAAAWFWASQQVASERFIYTLAPFLTPIQELIVATTIKEQTLAGSTLPLELTPGFRIFSITDGPLQAADQWRNLFMYIEEWDA